MQARIDRKELDEAFVLIRAVLPKMEKDVFYLTCNEKGKLLSITAQGDSARIDVGIPAKEVVKGEAIVPQAPFRKLSSNIEGVITFSEGKQNVIVKEQGSKFRLPKVNKTAPLPINLSSMLGPFSIPGETIRDACARVAFGAAKTFDRPSKAIQTGLAIYCKNNELSVETHQDHFMARFRAPDTAGNIFELVVPSYIASVIQRTKEEEISLYISKDAAVFSAGLMTLEIALLSQHHVNLDPIINRFSGCGIWTLEKEKADALVSALSKTLIFQSKLDSRTILQLSALGVVLSAKATDIGTGRVLFEDVEYEGEDVTRAVDGRMLLNLARKTTTGLQISLMKDGPGLMRVQDGNTLYIGVTDYV